VSLMSAEALEAALRDIGSKRYHHRHPFHALLHTGASAAGAKSRPGLSTATIIRR